MHGEPLLQIGKEDDEENDEEEDEDEEEEEEEEEEDEVDTESCFLCDSHYIIIVRTVIRSQICQKRKLCRKVIHNFEVLANAPWKYQLTPVLSECTVRKRVRG